jgi:hypothetical protein
MSPKNTQPKELQVYQEYLRERTGLEYTVGLEYFPGAGELAVVRLQGLLLSGQRWDVSITQAGQYELNRRLPNRIWYGSTYQQVVYATRAWYLKHAHRRELPQLLAFMAEKGQAYFSVPWYDYDENDPGWPSIWRWSGLARMKNESKTGWNDPELAWQACFEFECGRRRFHWTEHAIERLREISQALGFCKKTGYF